MTRIDDMPHAMQVLAARLAYALVEYSIAHDDDSSAEWLDLAWHVGTIAQEAGVAPGGAALDAMCGKVEQLA